MLRSVQRFVVFALLCWLPLQASALPALSLICEIDPAALGMVQGAAHADHGHQHGDDASGHDMDGHAHGDHDDGASFHEHGCCNHFSAAAQRMPVIQPDPPQAYETVPMAVRNIFIPEPLQRPPLALVL